MLINIRMETDQVEELLSIFNVSGTGKLSKQEFVFCWNEWIKKVRMNIRNSGDVCHPRLPDQPLPS